jgi:hypothetical protein
MGMGLPPIHREATLTNNRRTIKIAKEADQRRGFLISLDAINPLESSLLQ